MSSVAIVSTSINKQPKAYKQWLRQDHDNVTLIVAGDKNSPPELEDYIHSIGGEYLTPEEQDHRWEFSDALGWHCVQRRNAAVMEAYTRGFDYVVTVDDDNFPASESWVTEHIEHIEGVYTSNTFLIFSDSGWVDIGLLNSPSTRQRGVPYGVQERLHSSMNPGTWPDCVVSTAMVLGDPDCDAVSRIALASQVDRITMNGIVRADQWAAFNSQATMWRGDWAPVMACIPYIGRYDDILASFIAKLLMKKAKVSFYAGAPLVVQERNAHDPVRDLQAEVFGMEQTPRWIHDLEGAKINPDKRLVRQYRNLVQRLERHLPIRSTTFLRKWIEEWINVDEAKVKS